ncbi:hypothetical protein [Streptomyces sp. NPDC048442]|uniref:hypothetical protein n=1 Tax=Streptomyces sp. NPDC048442 TaxID=3154823 RepID=UPI003423DE8C
MNLSITEQTLLHAVGQSPGPVAMFSLFPGLSSAPPPQSDSPENDPVRVRWHEERFGLFEASVTLWQKGLVAVAHPANGEPRPRRSLSPGPRRSRLTLRVQLRFCARYSRAGRPPPR